MPKVGPSLRGWLAAVAAAGTAALLLVLSQGPLAELPAVLAQASPTPTVRIRTATPTEAPTEQPTETPVAATETPTTVAGTPSAPTATSPTGGPGAGVQPPATGTGGMASGATAWWIVATILGAGLAGTAGIGLLVRKGR